MVFGDSGTFTLWSISNFITLVIFFAVLALAYASSRKPDGIPRGPPLTLPIIGDIPILLRGNVLQTFRNLRKAYGDIFSFYLGKELVIVFNGHQTIRKAAAKNVFFLEDRRIFSQMWFQKDEVFFWQVDPCGNPRDCLFITFFKATE